MAANGLHVSVPSDKMDQVHTDGGAVVKVGKQVACHPLLTSVVLLVLLNAINVGFGLWWKAWALQVISWVVIVAVVLAYVCYRAKCFRFITTVLWIAPVVSGAIAIIAYRCLRSCSESFPPPANATCANCPDTEVGAYVWNPDLPFWVTNELEGAVSWFVSTINAVPEGISWTNAVVGLFGVVVSAKYWEWEAICVTLLCCGRADNTTLPATVKGGMSDNNIPLMALKSGGSHSDAKI
jgi:hypothetical protein